NMCCECQVSHCCCGCSLRNGSLAIGVVCAIFDIVFLVWQIIMSVGAAGGVAIGGWIGVTIYAIHLLMCVALIWGIVENKSGLCMIWVIGSIVFVIFEIIIGLVITIVASVGAGLVDAHVGGGLSVYMGPFIAIGVLMMIIAGVHIYFIVVIRSFART
ncbi:unnamed protein product, partial [Meganyctiphanes norvegica]